jgi:hypothetical protein
MKEFPPFPLALNECPGRHRDDGDDERVRLTPKAFAVLKYLVEPAGRLVRNLILSATLVSVALFWPEPSVAQTAEMGSLVGIMSDATRAVPLDVNIQLTDGPRRISVSQNNGR